VLAGAGLEIVLSGIPMPTMSSVTQRWIHTYRRELPDRTLTWNERHLLHAPRELESSCNAHRPHRAPGTGRTTAVATRTHRRP
jgi:hypothetical protein